MSLSEKVEFQVSSDFHNDKKMQNTLRRMIDQVEDEDEEAQFHRVMADSSSSYSSSTLTSPYQDQALFVDGAETYYDGYAQAWRYIGFYVDCNAAANNNNRRKLGDDNDGGCVRYLLWAAYVDPYYAGNGFYEYQFYDRWDDAWTSYCADEDSCRKMDCHLSDTHYKLMGFFKHADYGDWQEQLFKHEGVCVWTEDEFDFMYESEDLLPEGCSETGQSDEDGNYLYYALQPQANGDVSLGLYTDYMCSMVYGGSANVWDVVGAGSGDGGGSGDGTLEEQYEAFNSAFNIFKQCQPCVAYDLENGFECDDEAGYTNVNQCMKFSSKCEMGTATIDDVNRATEQGSTTSLQLMSASLTEQSYKVYSAKHIYIEIDDINVKRSHPLMWVGSVALIGLGAASIVKVHDKKAKQVIAGFAEPLMSQGGTYA